MIVCFALVIVLGILIFAIGRLPHSKNLALLTDDAKRASQDPMIDQIREGIKKSYPYLATLESSVNKLVVTIEDNSGGYAIGRYDFTQDSYGGSGTWFAKNTPDGWVVFNAGYNYWGDCKLFRDYEFPKELTPDCYDYEKLQQVETVNPERFFVEGFDLRDKEDIIRAYIAFKKSRSEKVARPEDLAVRVATQTKDYLEGMVLIDGVENHSSPRVLAVRTKEGWRVVFEGQDIPYCDVVDAYNFPVSIVSECLIRGKKYDLNDSPEKRVGTAGAISSELVNTSDWKTYRNEEYGFAIQYPKDWYVDTRYSDKDFSQRGPTEDQVFIGGDTYFANYPNPRSYNISNPPPADFRDMTLAVYKVDPSLSYESFVQYPRSVESRKISEEAINIAGVEAFRLTGITIDHPVGVTFVTTFIKDKNRMFVLSHNDAGKPTSENDRAIFESMVRSFRLVQD